MMKFIDADKLIADIENLYDNMLKRIKIDKDNSDYWAGKADAYRNVIDAIVSLQQEQPEADLEKEIIRYQREDMDRDTTVGDVARHFYKLGFNARKEE